MNTKHLANILAEHSDIVEASANKWQVTYNGRQFLLAVDERHDRMRVMSPIVDSDALEPLDFEMLLTANFDRTLDARYALSGGYLWAVYLHPLEQLTERMLVEALRQVDALAKSFGRSYTGGSLIFSGGE